MAFSISTLPELHVDLDALVDNYLWFCDQGNAKTCAAVKADAYGLGMKAIGPALYEAGCQTFFVAHIAEGVDLRARLGTVPVIYVLHGPAADHTDTFIEHDLRPVLNSVEQIGIWRGMGAKHPAALHIDTGMNRLGIAYDDIEQIDTNGLHLSLIMSHLACAAAPDHPLNQIQLQRFCQIRAQFPDIPASLCNSAGVLLGEKYHFDRIRPGIGLYGGAPRNLGESNPSLSPVARILAPIVQMKTVRKNDEIGYDATFTAKKDMQIALIAYGYADGLFRSIGPAAKGWIHGKPTPLLGQVSMDLMAVDLTDITSPLAPGAFVEFLGADLDQFAKSCNTVAYEMLTSIGSRVQRIYTKRAT